MPRALPMRARWRVFLTRNHEQLLAESLHGNRRSTRRALPGWLADSLINSLYYFAPCSMWAQSKDPIGSWCRAEDGLFALEESPRACPHMSTLSNVGMQGPTLSFFFPDCALSLLRAIRSTQKENGDVAQLMGRWADPANPMSYGYQEVISGLLLRFGGLPALENHRRRSLHEGVLSFGEKGSRVFLQPAS